MKKIIVIGSNSFSAGSFIKLLLLKNYKVYGISRSKLNPYSNYRLKNKISKCEIYYLKKINNILKNKYVSKYIC